MLLFIAAKSHHGRLYTPLDSPVAISGAKHHNFAFRFLTGILTKCWNCKFNYDSMSRSTNHSIPHSPLANELTESIIVIALLLIVLFESGLRKKCYRIQLLDCKRQFCNFYVWVYNDGWLSGPFNHQVTNFIPSLWFASWTQMLCFFLLLLFFKLSLLLATAATAFSDLANKTE